jgi:subtilisin family serine protease
MYGIGRKISAGAVASTAVVGLLVVATAPAAAGPGSVSRPFLTGVHARGQPARTLERAPRLAFPRARGSSKLDSALAKVAGAGGSRKALLRSAGLATTDDGMVRVVIETRTPPLASASVAGLGGRVERTFGNLVQAVLAPSRLAELSQRSTVDLVRAPFMRFDHALSGEEVAATLAAAWHAKGFTGEGVKVAIIDAGFEGLADRQAEGELPANVVTQDFCGGELATASEHGTAVAEIVYEMAPDAQLYLLCIGTEVDLASAEAYAKSQGVHVINHSAGWEGPFRNDGSGPIGAIVADARASGILWINSAGNEGQTHWSGAYSPDGNFHAWNSNGDIGNTFVWPDGTVICGFLRWDEWPAGVSDFDLGLFLSGSNIFVASSEEEQGGGEPPFEAVCVGQETGADLEVFWAIRGYSVSTSPQLDLVSWSPPLEYQVAAGSIAAPASSPAALAVGALCWQSRQLEPYSSQGPTIDGRMKPDIVGHDSVSGMTYGPFSYCPSAFAGTSASSPEVAGAAALVKQAYPAFGPDQVKQYLMRNARDLGAPGLDNVHGAGELQLPKPPDVVAPTATALVSAGRKGKALKLLATVSDDSGEVSVIELVKLGSKTVATIKGKGFVSAPSPRPIAVVWKVPANAKGAYRHCVRAIDRAGNSSPVSCAKVVVK